MTARGTVERLRPERARTRDCEHIAPELKVHPPGLTDLIVGLRFGPEMREARFTRAATPEAPGSLAGRTGAHHLPCVSHLDLAWVHGRRAHGAAEEVLELGDRLAKRCQLLPRVRSLKAPT